ncbi:hypothetical protein [Deinococcus multiflagellatus]|uniref:hypothetical protein n=1 Tax=Deinococcus multiflagellatus TaxID=1656887 RepID=UPI001CC9A6C6|nr:hypothetical protein [Deinococcus multiflagellatus]MBZ9713094.1 hypothetical protein [Deinococcus multiflagellatus]
MSKRRRPAPSPPPPTPPAGLGGHGELREVTPEMRARTQRTFLGILVGFFALIGLMVATLSWQGRAVRDYAVRVADAVLVTQPSKQLGYTQPCTQALAEPLPRGAEDCTVTVDGGRVTVTVTVQGERQYRITRPE